MSINANKPLMESLRNYYTRFVFLFFNAHETLKAAQWNASGRVWRQFHMANVAEKIRTSWQILCKENTLFIIK